MMEGVSDELDLDQLAETIEPEDFLKQKMMHLLLN